MHNDFHGIVFFDFHSVVFCSLGKKKLDLSILISIFPSSCERKETALTVYHRVCIETFTQV